MKLKLTEAFSKAPSRPNMMRKISFQTFYAFWTGLLNIMSLAELYEISHGQSHSLIWLKGDSLVNHAIDCTVERKRSYTLGGFDFINFIFEVHGYAIFWCLLICFKQILNLNKNPTPQPPTPQPQPPNPGNNFFLAISCLNWSVCDVLVPRDLDLEQFWS